MDGTVKFEPAPRASMKSSPKFAKLAGAEVKIEPLRARMATCSNPLKLNRPPDDKILIPLSLTKPTDVLPPVTVESVGSSRNCNEENKKQARGSDWSGSGSPLALSKAVGVVPSQLRNGPS